MSFNKVMTLETGRFFAAAASAPREAAAPAPPSRPDAASTSEATTARNAGRHIFGQGG
eukprot:CAMPEP_0179135252 /NCGR_PEP_ID=MMETSP0796-20121207/64392_1 /TAXON_ID=73915 /ORGANISM="Pyrodinium bahamense, Strain pbaha01" /LENGTH=57 /DNA_ID=CAMNT_0020834273 /DNA_START=63 /DNA_END=236 /DNA_ORIENTATION=-